MFILDLSLCRTDRNEKYVLEKSTNDWIKILSFCGEDGVEGVG